MGCGGGGIDELPGACTYTTEWLEVSPSTIHRGDTVDITVLWELSGPEVWEPTATFLVGESDAVQVEVPLLPQGADRFEAALLNPFGAGAPAGAGRVEVHARSVDCLTEPTASTDFVLQ